MSVFKSELFWIHLFQMTADGGVESGAAVQFSLEVSGICGRSGGLWAWTHLKTGLAGCPGWLTPTPGGWGRLLAGNCGWSAHTGLPCGPGFSQHGSRGPPGSILDAQREAAGPHDPVSEVPMHPLPHIVSIDHVI